ncbi:MAG: hypothetical protein JSW47_18795, partial [Phycisphaerales bacterium]
TALLSSVQPETPNEIDEQPDPNDRPLTRSERQRQPRMALAYELKATALAAIENKNDKNCTGCL